MSDSPPPRFLHWTMPAVGVPIYQLRPDSSYVQLIRGAVNDIRICRGVFEGWAAQLDQLSSEERERVLHDHLTLLREDVRWCSHVTDEILLYHAQFADLMAQRIDDASRSWLKGLKYSQDTTRLANDINKASRALSQHVTRMQENLKSFVSALEKMEVRKGSMVRRILGWSKHLNVLASILRFGSFVFLFLPVPPAVCMIASVGSVLCTAAAALCEAASERRAGRESESIESVLIFLKDVIPKEAQIAQKSLARFDEALFVMGLEARMKTGRRVVLRGPNLNLSAVAEEWRKIANQYRSMLPDDEDPDG